MVLEETLMVFLAKVQPKVAKAVVPVHFNACYCTGDCGQSCSGGCETGCTGDCGRSCSGGPS